MGIMGYDAMLTYGHHTGNSAGLRSAGSAADGGRAAVRPEGVAERGGPPGGSERARGAAVVSCVAGPGATGPKGRGARGPQAAAGPRRAGQGRAGAAAGSAGAWLCHGSLDPAAGGDAHSAADRGAVPSGARLVSAPGVELVGAASRAPGPGTRRGSDRAVEAYAVGAGKKNARRRRAWLVFEDESGLSHHPVVRRTWAPRGQPPILTHVGSNWKRLSIAAALAFRWDGHRRRVYFQTRPGTYTDERLITFLRALKRHFRRRRVILLWDGLAAHKSRRMRAYLARQRPWLQVERLPAYAPELNPVEQIWGNIKGRDLANLCPTEVLALRRPVQCGFARVRRDPDLAFSFLRHTGLSVNRDSYSITREKSAGAPPAGGSHHRVDVRSRHRYS